MKSGVFKPFLYFCSMQRNFTIASILQKHSSSFHPVVKYDQQTDIIASLDLSINNQSFTEGIYSDPDQFNAYIENQKQNHKAKFLVGGYREHRGMYKRSVLFNQNKDEQLTDTEPRSLHLGIDIWGETGTKIYAPLGGIIHSFAFNNNFGDYGATIILQHQLETINFFSLYGHLSLHNLEQCRVGRFITRGEAFAHIGPWEENGNWPPHLHFQLIADIGNYTGDYPGVCKMSEAQKYLSNCPDPNIVLNIQPTV